MSIFQSVKGWLLILLCLLLAYSILNSFYPRASLASHSQTPVPRKPKSTTGGTNQVLSMSQLNNNPPEFSTVHRNIFEFGGSTESDIPEPIQLQPAKQSSIPEKPQLPDVRYLAFYQEKDTKSTPIAAIINGGRIYVGVQGDTLAGKYEILQIDDEFILLRFLPDNRIIRLPMGKESGVVVEEKDSANKR
jgi:hypothetical protein